ncbi:unnamed protein product [Prorocentrum cordatum]|uniref:Pyrrolo-quinoline quinone repeat domain-containing protein n=1 Tax=Prorocentrum cordatum TaxID=2364126 RepID=A0ABN9RRJ3_9DINO|nr:unnamed protein product [Polarella glacialis]
MLDGSSDKTEVGKMNKMGVTRYRRHAVKRTKRSDGKFFWADSSNRDGDAYTGATDLLDNVTWGWHHPSGTYNTIPVGSPLIDDQQNIYIGSDDAIRKFDVTGTILWSYAPRGQLAAAPTLVLASSRRLDATVVQEGGDDAEEERELRPDWVSGNESVPSVGSFEVGDLVRVKPGFRYQADGKELYKAGDTGMITAVEKENGETESRAVISWTRTGHKSVVQLHAMGSRFSRVESKNVAATLPSMLVGSTTSGFVFAIDLASGEELWATWASNDIAGVKGSVAGKDGIIVVATDRCTDRYCYRYRNQTNPLTPGNSKVRGLSAADGSAIWEFKTFAPVWNMAPLWGPRDTVLFQDYEGRAYSLDLATGSLRFQVGGDIGTHTHAGAVYDPGHNILFALGMRHYNVETYHMEDAIGTDGGKFCNPYVAPGILINCWTWQGGRGFVRAYNATSGRSLWDLNTPEPPASASTGMVSALAHTRLIVTMGFNCAFNSPSQIWSIDPNNGHIRWMKDGPTLWTSHCAGDREGADIRRAMGGRATCSPNSWSLPAVDSAGDVYVGNQVGVLQRWGSPGGVPGTRNVDLLSTLTTGVAFQDAAIAFADGIMAVTTCTSLLVFQTYAEKFNGSWSVAHDDYSPSSGMVHGDEASHQISETPHTVPTGAPGSGSSPWDVR